MTPFRAISVFHQVATLNSVSAAAEQLNVTPSAVTQQIRALEEQIGTALVVRVGRRIRLTEAGERFFELIADQVETIISATQLMQGSKTATRLTIRTTPTVSTKWLLPRLPQFLEANPDIDLRLDGTNEPTDFNRDHVDLDIRHGTGRWAGLHVEPLAVERFMPVCSPKLADPFSLEPADLLTFRMIRSVKAQIQWEQWFTHFDLRDTALKHHLLFDRSHMAVDAAVLGMGVALESNLMMGQELRDRRLVVPVRGAPEMLISTQWLVCPHTHMRRSRVRKFIDWVKGEAALWQSESEAASLS
ncbi:Glycine cleavage system transcriptional activator [Aquimixticola soesokkakensis]|uniref:Glycine cleavage system transcriptional activator n=1 Tax=Aquimixticola soesokkakensis TaxID=1519096 RepID=A0A1Y5RZV0_9RHOB|nr:LysR substrate-binding domain-containing protein [Aquimixticola soesokkakensis]SLN26761.1 Glycine cleavage system transcriptional activator [Aquimixticola soesokkakensis]